MVILTEKIYEIRIPKAAEGKIQEPKAIAKKEQETKTNNEIIGTTAKATIGAIATVYAASQTVIRPTMVEMINNAVASGDVVKARAMQNNYDNVGRVVNLGLEAATIGATALINPYLGGLAIFGSLLKHTTEAINRGQTNYQISELNKVQNFLSAHESARMINVKGGDNGST